jgi:hypothetical protein
LAELVKLEDESFVSNEGENFINGKDHPIDFKLEK